MQNLITPRQQFFLSEETEAGERREKVIVP